MSRFCSSRLAIRLVGFTSILLAAIVPAMCGAEELRAAPSATSSVSTESITRLRTLGGPLEPAWNPAPEENRDLAAALSAFAARTSRDDCSALNHFLSSHPDSAWEMSLLSQLGREFYRTGHYTKALAAWEQVWRQSRARTNAFAPLAFQRATSELANLYARLGRMSELEALLNKVRSSTFFGQYSQSLRAAEDGLWSMEHRPEIAFRCGPLALDRIRAWGNPTNACHPLIFNSRSTTNGMCLADVAQLSRDLGMNYQIAFRTPGAKLIVPAVVHWKVGHYAALVREKNGLFLAQDPTFWNDTWTSSETLDEEASGYFLVPPGPLPEGWRGVTDLEGHAIWGKGTTGASSPDATTSLDPELNSCEGAPAMPAWNFNLMLVNQRITDTPIGYQPPVGPPVFFTIILNAQDNWRRSLSGWGTTLGIGWTCNWISFIQDDPLNPSGNLRLYLDGGWLTFIEDPKQDGVFRCQFRNPGTVVRLSTNGVVAGYVWNFPDGTRRVYGHTSTSDQGVTTRDLMMSAIIDSSGNSVLVEYDDNYYGRIHGIVDALGRRTTLQYGLTDPGYPTNSPISSGNSQFNWQVTKITDPFGRSAIFDYQLTLGSAQIVTDSGTLTVPAYFYYVTNITDVAGMSSQLEYDSAFATDNFPVVSALTTPYGATRFKAFYKGRDFGFEIMDPNGDVERLEYSENNNVNVPGNELQQDVPTGMTSAENLWLFARNVYYWSKKAYAEGFSTNDYSKAVIYHFTHAQNLTACGPILESIKRPLENRVWFNYPGQGAGWFPGTDDHPSKIGRVLDDGSTQLTQFEYNDLGNVTHSIDPAGRTFTFIYDTNGVDLLESRQTRNGQNELLSKASYNGQHLPMTVTDAAGQVTAFTYNARGQLLTTVNPRNETNRFEYDTNGYLTAIDGPLPGSQDRDTFTYDSLGRVRTATDQDGYTIALDHDNLDRLTKLTFPDGTYQQITYDRLKPGTVRDRLGRVTSYTYTSLGQLASVQDPLGRLTRFQWCRCGELDALIDSMGRMTSWPRDIQGRATAKQYADGTAILYEYERTTSRLHRVRDGQNQITQFEYYADNTLKRKNYLNAKIATPPVLFTYDPYYQRVATMQDGEGTTTYGYYPITTMPALGAGRLASIDGPWANDTIAFTYDELGRIASSAINGIPERRVFDAAGRLSQVTNVLGSFAYAWEGGSTRLSAVHYPNGQRAQYTYQPNLRDQLLQSITHYLPDNSVLSQFTYDYNAAGLITNWLQVQAGVTRTWVSDHDDADRLTAVTITQGGAPLQTFTYVYDDGDNRTIEKVDATRRDFSYNALNQIISISNTPVNGVSYEWDAANRLVAINNGAHRTEFSYDGHDRRTRIVDKDNNTLTSDRHYLWCDVQLCEERDASGGVVLKQFLSGGQRVSPGANLPAGDYFFTADHLGSIRELTDQSGVRAVFTYDPFGLRHSISGGLEADVGFGGLFMDATNGLHLGTFRSYDPRLGRWLSRDPAGESAGANLYAYVGNSPITRIDPLGLDGINFSVYAGIGGGIGVKWNSATGNYSVTTELGFGEGASIGYSPLSLPPVPDQVSAGETDYSQVSINADVGLGMGPVGASGGLSSKSCYDGKFKMPEASGDANVGPFSLSSKDTSFGPGDFSSKPQFKVKMKDDLVSALGITKKVGVSAKANVKVDFIKFDPTPLITPSAVSRNQASSGPAYIKTGPSGQYTPLNQWQNQ